MEIKDEEKIREALEEKTWNEVMTHDSWSVFKIMSEFVHGYETLSNIGPCVSIFGSARLKPENKYYKEAEHLAYMLVKEGFGIITGGGPGIMEAGNKGAHYGNGKSVGLNIKLPHEQHANPFIDADKSINFDYFYIRKTMFLRYSQGFVVFPGGFGTLDEMSEALTLIQTNKLVRFPIVLVGHEFWDKLVDWFKGTLLANGLIAEEDLNIFHIVDTAEEAAEIICDFYKQFVLKPNF